MRLLMSEHVLPCVVGVAMAILAFTLPSVSTAHDITFPALWPWMFGAAGLMCFAYAACPWSTFLRALSGTLVSCSFGARGVALLAALVAGKLPFADVRVGLVVWNLLALLTAIVWEAVLLPPSEARRAIRASDRELARPRTRY